MLRITKGKPYGYEKIYIDNDLIEDQLIDQFNEKTLIMEIFILHYSTTCIHFIMEMEELVRGYLFYFSLGL